MRPFVRYARFMSGDQRHEAGLLDFGALGERLRSAAGLLGVIAVAGVMVDGLRSGLTFAVMVRWGTAYVIGLLLVAAVLVAVQALRCADMAQRRGESLSGADVGLVPPRPPRE